MKNIQRYSGVVKWYSIKKCYGFIVNDSTGDDVFVHFTNITQGRKKGRINAGDAVTFVMVTGKTGMQAGDVKLA